jgi:hypothetical protein
MWSSDYIAGSGLWLCGAAFFCEAVQDVKFFGRGAP